MFDGWDASALTAPRPILQFASLANSNASLFQQQQGINHLLHVATWGTSGALPVVTAELLNNLSVQNGLGLNVSALLQQTSSVISADWLNDLHSPSMRDLLGPGGFSTALPEVHAVRKLRFGGNSSTPAASPVDSLFATAPGNRLRLYGRGFALGPASFDRI